MAQAILTPTDLEIFTFGKGVAMAFGLPQGPGPEEISKATEDLRNVLGSALIVGGLAVIHYGYRRFTDDIDILYANADAKILERLKPDFSTVVKAHSGWHELKHRKTGVRLELIPEGGLGTYGFIPSLKTVAGEGGFISLMGLVWLKLVSGRAQDVADIVVLAKVRYNDLGTFRDKLPLDLRDRFAECLAQAKREMAFVPSRLPHVQEGDTGAGGVGEAPGRYGKRKRAARPKGGAAK